MYGAPRITTRSDRRGFTLIELVIVVVIIGVLAAIAIPKFASTKERAMVTTMKADLRNLATAQESYLYSYDTYYPGPLPNAALGFSVSSRVTITLANVTAGGWSATATHAGAPGRTCALFYGSAPPVPPAVAEGLIACN